MNYWDNWNRGNYKNGNNNKNYMDATWSNYWNDLDTCCPGCGSSSSLSVLNNMGGSCVNWQCTYHLCKKYGCRKMTNRNFCAKHKCAEIPCFSPKTDNENWDGRTTRIYCEKHAKLFMEFDDV